jgi:hypothetical protein
MYERLSQWVTLIPLAVCFACARALEHPTARMLWKGPSLHAELLEALAPVGLSEEEREDNGLPGPLRRSARGVPPAR